MSLGKLVANVIGVVIVIDGLHSMIEKDEINLVRVGETIIGVSLVLV